MPKGIGYGKGKGMKKPAKKKKGPSVKKPVVKKKPMKY